MKKYLPGSTGRLRSCKKEGKAMKGNRAADPFRVSRGGIMIEAMLEYFISILTTGAFLAKITESLGFSDSLTGVLSSFVSLGCLFQLSSVLLLRNLRTVKRAVMIAHLINELLFVFVYIAPVVPLGAGAKTAIFLVSFCGANIIHNVMRANKSEWQVSLVDDGKRGMFTAKKEMMSLLGGMIFTYAMGAVFDHLEARGQVREAFMVGAAAVLGLMIFHLLSLTMIKEKPTGEKKDSTLQESLKILFSNAMFKRVVILIILWYAASACATPFYGAYQVGELGFSMTFVSLLSILYAVVRTVVSPLLGKYADRTSFSRMNYLCYMVAAAGFLVNCFTAPENGKVFYAVYYALYAIAMGGINSGLTNLVFDHVQGENRRNALAITFALGGLTGFLTTCLMSPLVAYIQNNGNRIFGLSVYAAQFVSAIAFLLTVVVILYVRFALIAKEKKLASK